MDDHIRQAADVLGNVPMEGRFLTRMAEALADAGLLVTPEQRAVLDAADTWRDFPPNDNTDECAALVIAVDALRAATRD